MKGKWSQRQGLFEHTCIRQCTTGAEKGGGDVCGTQECDRTASPALTSDAVRSGAVLPCSGGPEHQATGAFPQPTDNTHGASHRLTELSEENGDTRSRKEIRLTPFFNTHCGSPSKPTFNLSAMERSRGLQGFPNRRSRGCRSDSGQATC